MKNKNIIKVLWLFVIVASFSSCTPEDESFAKITDKPKVSLPVTSFSATEGDDIQVTLVADHPYKYSMDFNLEVLSGGTATDVDDFAVDLDETVLGNDPWNGIQGYLMSFPANATSYTFSISSILDDLAEGTENVTFKIHMSGNHNGVIEGETTTFTVAIANKVQDKLVLVFDWDQSFDFGGSTYTLCDIAYDNDYLLVDSTSNIVAAAASSDCPETLEMDINDYADGDYDVYQNLYDNAGLDGAAITPAFSIPTTVHYNRPGSATLSGTYVQDAAYAFDSDAPSDPGLGDPRYVVSVHIEGGVFTLFDDNGNIASGRAASVKNALKNYKNKNLHKVAKRGNRLLRK